MDKKENTRVSDANPKIKELKEAIAIAAAQRPKDTLAHDWVRMDGILCCSKCGQIHFDKVLDGRIYGKCTVDTDAPVN